MVLSHLRKITRRKKKGMKDFIRGIIEENQGGFENSRGKYVDRYDSEAFFMRGRHEKKELSYLLQ